MQDSLHPKLTAKIAARNAPGYVRTRLTLRFSLLYFAMFVAGLLLCRGTPLGSLPAVSDRVTALFKVPFADCAMARDYVREVLDAARPDLILLALTLVSGMTFFTAAACEAMLAVQALRFGMLCGGAMAAVMGGIPSAIPANLAFFVYFFSQLVLAGILLAAAIEAVVFSYEYRDACRVWKRSGDAVTVGFLLRALSLGGSTVLLCVARAAVTVLLANM